MCQVCSSIETNSGDAFATKLMGMLNGGAIALMVSVGHRTGLFDILAAGPGTSEELAERASLEERYVREWLGAMVAGEIVTIDSQTRVYTLPEDHAAWLTRAAAPANMAVSFQFLPMLGAVEDAIVESFKNGGGVPYEAYPRFHEVMAQESDQSVVSGLEDAILPLVDGLIERLERGIDVLDVGCGRGHAMMALAARFPNSRFRGFDLSTEAVAHAIEESRQRGLHNIDFEVRILPDFELSERFDLITGFDVIHDQKDPDGLLKGIHASLRPEGVFLAQDIYGSSDVAKNADNPIAPFVYTISCLHCMTVSLAQGGKGLGAAWGRELAEEMMRAAGFATVAVNTLEHDVMNYFYVCRK